jgi:Reverse transcriptase (RNA-dependent DNA polymerase)
MKMDIQSGYNNIRIHPNDRWKAAFTTEFGLFEPNIMFFGLCNSPATFQAYMNRTFQQEINEGWMVIYMDDILIFSTTMAEHRERTRRVLMKIQKEYLFLKPEKCTFDAEEVEYLGMIIRPGQVAMDTAKTKGISEWPVPKSVKDVWSFLGFCNFYHTFISHYSDIA